MDAVKKKKGISGSTLKLIAIVTMTIDHFGAAFLGRFMMSGGFMEIMYSSDANAIMEWLAQNGVLYTCYTVTRLIGRIAFPIYCFLLVEGFLRTRDVRKYALRLGLFALISEIPFDLAFKAKVLEFSYQNIFFTLLLGLLTMIACDVVERTAWKKPVKVIVYGVMVIAGAALAEFMMTDYGAAGVLCIMALFLFRRTKRWQITAGCLAFLWEGPTAMAAFIPIAFYNGERGMKLKYFFYAFYPAHLLIIYLLSMLVGLAGYAVV